MLLLLWPAAANAAVGDRDQAFNFTGKVTFDDGQSERVNAVAVQPDGKLVLLGESSSQNSTGFLRRLHPDGTPDERFGERGVVKIGPGNTTEREHALLLQPDGKILVGGESSFRAVIHRFDAQGRPDGDWGTAGRAQVTTGNDLGAVRALALNGDGRIVAAGTAGNGGVVWRLTATGNPDPAFNTTGRLFPDPGKFDEAVGVAVQADGKIIVAGKSGFDTAAKVMRLNVNQGVDQSFNVALLDAGGFESAAAMVVQGDGRIVVVGNTTPANNGVIWRLRSDGDTDTSFNQTGRQILDGGDPDQMFGLAVQPDGKPVVVGQHRIPAGPFDGVVYRLKTDGGFDGSFGGDGSIAVETDGISESLMGVAVQADGNLVLGGAVGGDGLLYRLLGDPHRLTVNAVGPGTVSCGGPCAPLYDVGTVVTLTATPSAGASLTGWTGCTPTGNVCRVTMSAARSVTATFEKDPPLPTTPGTGGGGSTGGGGGTTGGGGGTPADRLAPKFTAVRLVKGRAVSFRLSEAARVTVKVGSKTVTRSLRGGQQKVAFRRPKRGRHKVVLNAVDAAGNRAKPVTLKLTVK